MRFYVSPESIFPETHTIEIRDREEVHHIRDVMRLRKGTMVSVFDGRGKGYRGDIKEISKDLVAIEIKNTIDFRTDSPFNITLYQAIPKKTRMDFIVEKAVELGVGRIVPIVTERTTPLIKDKGRKKTERWLRIAKAASKQCGRVKLPLISDVMDFNNALIESKKNDITLLAALDKDARPLKPILKGAAPKTIAVFIGPEGDFSPPEVLMAKKEGCRICSLGLSTLKSETAAIYLLSSISYEYTP